MRVMMLAHSFPREEGDLAGAFIWRLAEALVDRGHEVTAVAPAERGETGAPVLGRIAVRRVRYAVARHETLAYHGTMHLAASRSAGGALAFAGMVRALSRAAGDACRSGRADVVHAHWWIPAGLAASLARRGGRPFVITLHGTDVALATRVPGARWAFGAVLKRAAAITAVSSVLADQAASASGRPRAEIAVLPMPLLPTGGAHDGERRGAIFVGRLTQQKGVAHLLEALATLARRRAAPDLTIVGDGPERPALEERAVALGLTGSVTFVGAVRPDQVPHLLAGKRVFVLPSVDEGLGLAAAEALVAGVPVVAARSGGIPDLLTDPDAGVLVPPGDPEQLAEGIQRVLAEERYLSGAARAGAELARRLSPPAVAAAYERVYAAALGRGARS